MCVCVCVCVCVYVYVCVCVCVCVVYIHTYVKTCTYMTMNKACMMMHKLKLSRIRLQNLTRLNFRFRYFTEFRLRFFLSYRYPKILYFTNNINTHSSKYTYIWTLQSNIIPRSRLSSFFFFAGCSTVGSLTGFSLSSVHSWGLAG